MWESIVGGVFGDPDGARGWREYCGWGYCFLEKSGGERCGSVFFLLVAFCALRSAMGFLLPRMLRTWFVASFPKMVFCRVRCGGVVYVFVESSSCLCGENGMIPGQVGSRERISVLQLFPV